MAIIMGCVPQASAVASYTDATLTKMAEAIEPDGSTERGRSATGPEKMRSRRDGVHERR